MGLEVIIIFHILTYLDQHLLYRTYFSVHTIKILLVEVNVFPKCGTSSVL